MPNGIYTPRILPMQLTEGDPGAAALFGARTARGVAEAVPTGDTPLNKFTSSLLGLVRQQELAQAQRITAPAEPGMPPAIQRRVREAEAEVYTPSIRDIRDIMEQARTLSSQIMLAEDRARDDARDLIEWAYKVGGKSAAIGLPENVKKTAGYTKGFFEALPDITALEWTEPYQLPTGETVQKKATGEIKIISRGRTAAQSRYEQEMLRYVALGTSNLNKAKEMLGIKTDPVTGGWSVPKKARTKLLALAYSPFKLGVRTLNSYYMNAANLLAYTMSGRGVYGSEFQRILMANEPKAGDTIEDIINKMTNVEDMFKTVQSNPSMIPIPPGMETTMPEGIESMVLP